MTGHGTYCHGPGVRGSNIGLDDLRSLFQPNRFRESVFVCSLAPLPRPGQGSPYYREVPQALSPCRSGAEGETGGAGAPRPRRPHYKSRRAARRAAPEPERAGGAASAGGAGPGPGPGETLRVFRGAEPRTVITGTPVLALKD